MYQHFARNIDVLLALEIYIYFIIITHYFNGEGGKYLGKTPRSTHYSQIIIIQCTLIEVICLSLN